MADENPAQKKDDKTPKKTTKEEIISKASNDAKGISDIEEKVDDIEHKGRIDEHFGPKEKTTKEEMISKASNDAKGISNIKEKIDDMEHKTSKNKPLNEKRTLPKEMLEKIEAIREQMEKEGTAGQIIPRSPNTAGIEYYYGVEKLVDPNTPPQGIISKGDDRFTWKTLDLKTGKITGYGINAFTGKVVSEPLNDVNDPTFGNSIKGFLNEIRLMEGITLITPAQTAADNLLKKFPITEEYKRGLQM